MLDLNKIKHYSTHAVESASNRVHEINIEAMNTQPHSEFFMMELFHTNNK